LEVLVESFPDAAELQSQVTDLVETLYEVYSRISEPEQLDSYGLERLAEEVEATLRRYDAL
jgi:hypothetical protein